MQLKLILTTFPDEVGAKHAAMTLLQEELAACVNLIPGITSIYRWESDVTVSDETFLIVKTSEEGVHRVEARIRELHPYSVPEFVVISPESVGSSYLEWALGTVKSSRS